MEQFPHLKFTQKLIGKPRFHGGGSAREQSDINRTNRQGHSNLLSQSTTKIKSDWANTFQQRQEEQFTPILDELIVPIFMQVNPDLLSDIAFSLEKFAIEIISEERDGFIIGASLDNLQSLEDKIKGFIEKEHGSGKVADFWDIIDSDRGEWKPKHVLSEELWAKWPDIVDDEVYKVEVGIAFDKPLGPEPDPDKQGGPKRLEKYRNAQVERDDRLMQRESHFEAFVNHYGQLTSSIIHLEDSFGCEVEISGIGLKDLVKNYQFVFEVREVETIKGLNGEDSNLPDFNFDTIEPGGDAPEIGILDSGIMENHKYLEKSIIPQNSKSYLQLDTSTADKVKGGGHGTKVAGATLYPKGISHLASPYQLPFFVRNLRILDDDNYLTNQYPAELMDKIVNENDDCNIFNLSVNERGPLNEKHMSSWAAMIDTLIHKHDILFIVSVGNIERDIIQFYLNKGISYPNYLKQSLCRLANPSQSSFALTVGSINHEYYEDDDWRSLGTTQSVSAFSRIGTGIWDSIKPDVVEFGGGYVVSKNGKNQITKKQETAVEVVRSTLHGGGAYGKDCVGTSYSTPKVTHIAGRLKELYPNEGSNLIRALVVQGARLPDNYFRHPSLDSIRFFGYGLPDIGRVTKNTDHRITFYNTNSIQAEEAHIYSLQIPSNLRNQGDEYDILIEVTLAYSAKVRRTRQRLNSYLGTWLDWTSSKNGESFEDYQNYVLKELNGMETEYDIEERSNLNNYRWEIKTRSDRGVEGISRNRSSVQKDWTILKSYELPEEINFAVRGHKGWDKNKSEVPYALAVSIEILNAEIPIYEVIRIENELEIEVQT